MNTKQRSNKTGRVNIVKPREQHRIVAQKLVETNGRMGEAMAQAGYSKSIQKNPYQVMESRGFKQICEDVGLTDNFLLKALEEDIRRKPQRRKAELELAFKVKGHLTEKQSDISQATFNIVNYHATIQAERQEIVAEVVPSDTPNTPKA